MASPTRKRILVKGATAETVRDRVAGYGELYPPGDDTWTLTIRQAVDGWVQVDVPPGVPMVHFHNLAKWFEGDAQQTGAADVVTLSEGDPPWAYWLVPCRDQRADWFLTGADATGRCFQWDCTTRTAVDDPSLQRAPMTTRIALMTRNVATALHDAAGAPPAFAQVVLQLDVPSPTELEMPEPGSLAESFARTEAPAALGGFEQVMELAGTLLSPKKSE